MKDNPPGPITKNDLDAYGNVNTALENFYKSAIEDALEEAKVNEIECTERHLRYWIVRNLITDDDTRNLVIQTLDDEETEGMPKEIINYLTKKSLLNKISRGLQNWIELSHDRFIPIIKSNNESWEKNLRLLLKNAAYWSDKNDSKYLLTPDQFKEELQWVEKNKITLSSDEEKFVEACWGLVAEEQAKIDDAVAQEKARRTRLFAVIASVLAAVGIIFAVVAFYFYMQANTAAIAANAAAMENATLASINEVIAETARAAEAIANTEKDNAEQQRGLAQTAASEEQIAADEARDQKATAEALMILADEKADEAETAKATAEFNYELAQEQASIAFSRQLAAQAQGYLNSQPDLSSLLSIEAYGVSQTWEARSMLLANTQYGLQHTFQGLGAVLPLQNTDITAVALSLDGARMAWADADGNVTIYNYKNGEVEVKEDAHNSAVGGLAFSPDGKTLASGGVDKKINLWNVPTGRLTNLAGAVAAIYALAYSPDGRWLAATTGTAVSVWDLDDLNENPVILRGHTSDVYALTWSPNSKQIASGGGDRRVIIWDIDIHQRVKSFRDHQDQIRALTWSQSDLLASGSLDGDIFIKNMKTDELVAGPFNPHKGGIYSLAFNYGSDLLASGGGDHKIFVTDMDSMQEVAQYSDYYIYGVNCLAFLQLPGSNILASGSFDNSLGLHNVVPVQPLSEISQTLDGEIIALQVDSDNRALLGLKSSAKCEIHELLDGNTTRLFQVPGNCFSLAISPDLRKFSVGDSRGRINLYDAMTGELIGEPMTSEYDSAQAMAFNTEGRLLASSHCGAYSQDNGDETCVDIQIQFWDVINSQPLETNIEFVTDSDVDPGKIYSLVFKRAEDIIAFGGDGQRIFQWWIDESTFMREVSLPMDGHTGRITALAYGPPAESNVDMLASAGKDNMLILWNDETSQQLNGALPQATETILSIAFANDGLYLLTGSQDGALAFWDIDPQSWIDRLCKLAGRNLSPTEWAQFFPGEEYRETCK